MNTDIWAIANSCIKISVLFISWNIFQRYNMWPNGTLLGVFYSYTDVHVSGLGMCMKVMRTVQMNLVISFFFTAQNLAINIFYIHTLWGNPSRYLGDSRILWHHQSTIIMKIQPSRKARVTLYFDDITLF